MKPKSKTKAVGIIYEYRHTELCYTCGKEGQSYIQRVDMTALPTPNFHRSGIPVGWVSSYDGVYCSEECYKQAIIAKRKEHD